MLAIILMIAQTKTNEAAIEPAFSNYHMVNMREGEPIPVYETCRPSISEGR
jgi:hypothetical protein